MTNPLRATNPCLCTLIVSSCNTFACFTMQPDFFLPVFGETMAVASEVTYLIINIVLIVVGPLVVGLLIFAAYRQRKLYWFKRGWGRLPATFIVSAGLTFGVAWVFSFLNPFVRLPACPIIQITLTHYYLFADNIFICGNCTVRVPRNQLHRRLRHNPSSGSLQAHPTTAFCDPPGEFCFLVDIPPSRHCPYRNQKVWRPLFRYLFLFGHDSRVDPWAVGTF